MAIVRVLWEQWAGGLISSLKIGDNRAYVDSDGKEPKKEEDSEGSEHSLPQPFTRWRL